MGRFKTIAAVLVGVSIIAVFLNISSVYIWDGSSAHGTNNVEHMTPDIPEKDSSSAEIPIVLWWTDFTHEPGAVQQCGSVSCFFTNNRSYIDNPRTKGILFYGSSLEFHDLPLPRKPHHEWAIIHEESPKNNWAFSNEKFMSLFNHTATFQRNSDFPLTLIWLSSIEAIESHKYYHTVEEKNRFSKELSLAPIAYIQSDCGAPSDRDALVKILSKHIKVDCLGKCLHNKDLPEHLTDNLRGMDHNDFYELLSKYKFVMAAENAVCEDYITEKFWRSFYVGTVPIVYGSPTIKDWIPSPGSAIVVDDHKTMSSLVNAINDLNTDDSAYRRAIDYKIAGVSNKLLLDQMKARKWGTVGDEISFVDSFQCYICERLSSRNVSMFSKPVGIRGLNCPKPKAFAMDDVKEERSDDFWWPGAYMQEIEKSSKLGDSIKFA